MYKKLISVVVLSSCIVIPTQAMERKESHYVSDIVKIGSGLALGALGMYYAFVKPQQKEIERLEKMPEAFAGALEFAYFNRNEEFLNQFLKEHGLQEQYKVEEAKMVLNERSTNILCVIKERREK